MPQQKLKLEHIDQVSGSDAHFPAIKAWVEIVEAGHGFGEVLSISWDDRVSVFRCGKKIVALIEIAGGRGTPLKTFDQYQQIG